MPTMYAFSNVYGAFFLSIDFDFTVFQQAEAAATQLALFLFLLFCSSTWNEEEKKKHK
jgi:hypothetical protein